MNRSRRNESVKRVKNPMKRFMLGSWRISIRVVLASLLLVITLFSRTQVYAHESGDHPPIGAQPLSHNWYRVPFDVDVSDGEFVRVHPVNVRQNGHNGVDMSGLPSLDDDNDPNDLEDADVGYRIVASADGIVRKVIDDNRWRRPPPFPGDAATYPNNAIFIEHANDEWTVYVHIAQNSAQVAEGDQVSAGEYIADEGEVGGATGIHLHFAVFYGHDGTPLDSISSGYTLHFKGQRVPLVCGINNRIFEVGETYSDGVDDNGAIAPCGPTPFFIDAEWGGQTIAAGEIEVEQAIQTITVPGVDFVQDYTIQSNGSVAFHAGESITLRPGFHAEESSYFHAQIGPCQIGPCNTSPN